MMRMPARRSPRPNQCSQPSKLGCPGSTECASSLASRLFDSPVCPPAPPHLLQALREGGVEGVVEGPAPIERRLPPRECLAGRMGGSDVIIEMGFPL